MLPQLAAKAEGAQRMDAGSCAAGKRRPPRRPHAGFTRGGCWGRSGLWPTLTTRFAHVLLPSSEHRMNASVSAGAQLRSWVRRAQRRQHGWLDGLHQLGSDSAPNSAKGSSPAAHHAGRRAKKKNVCVRTHLDLVECEWAPSLFVGLPSVSRSTFESTSWKCVLEDMRSKQPPRENIFGTLWVALSTRTTRRNVI